MGQAITDAEVTDADGSTRAAAVDAALAELQQWGVDRFSIEGAAQRSGISPQYFRQTWESDCHLMIEALLDYSETTIAMPDTGSLLGDLTELALSVAAYLNEPVGRRLLRMLVVDSRSQAVDEVTRAQFWSTRMATIDVVFRRAADRGELPSDVAPFPAIQMLLAPLHTFALYTDIPVDPDYCRSIARLVTRAIT